MKKLFSPLLSFMLALALVVGFSAIPEVTTAQTAPLNQVKKLTASKTSLSNADTSNMVITAPSSSWNTATFTVSVTKGTGTVAGSIVLLGRNATSDEWVPVGSVTAHTLTDIAKNLKGFEISGASSGYKFYNVSVRTSGTVTATVVPGSAYFQNKVD